MSTLVAQTISNGTVSTSSTNCIRGSARAWVNYNGVTQTINSSFNVSSVTYNATGDYTLNFTTAFANINYVSVGSCSVIGGSREGFVVFNLVPASGAAQAPTTTTQRFGTVRGNISNNPEWVYVSVFS
jgi:hypothetical protein